MVAVSGVMLASSLLNAIPTQAWNNPVPSSEASIISGLDQDPTYPQIIQENFKEIAYRLPLQNDCLKKEIFLEKQLLGQSKSQPSSQKSTGSQSSDVTTVTTKKTGPSTPTKPKPTQTPPPTQSVKISSAQAVSRGAGEIDRLLSRANSLLGVPYLWGGTTPKGFDCSGFVGYVFKASGVSLPRTSFDMYKIGTPVSRDQLKPGDLVFFSTYTAGASDVRIYIGGNRTIGSSSDGVAIHSLSESYWNKTYLGARRVL